MSGVEWSAIAVPTELPELVDDPLTYDRVIMNPGATWDYFPGHFDPDYAREQGQPTIYVNTMHLAGFVDRAATQWAGPRSRVVRRSISLAGSVYAGDTMTARRSITGKRREGERWLVDLHVDVVNQHGDLCVPADVSLDVSLEVSGVVES